MFHFDLPQDVNAILNRLHDHGYEAFIVGGCVRDLLMGHNPHDYDVTTNARPEEVKEIFAGLRIVDTGIKHGTVTLVVNNASYEITTYRRETTYNDHRHPDSVEFSSSLKEDVERRDFTVNGLAYDHEHGVIDYVNGIEDIKKGIIRCIGEPDERFNEDALRILRCLRFASRFGFAIDEKTSQAVIRNRELLKYISSERINSELKEILTNDNTARYLGQYRDVFAVFMPEISWMFEFDQCNIHHSLDLWQHTLVVVENTHNDPVTRWAALFHDIGKVKVQTFDTNGQGHYYGHEVVSHEVAVNVLKRLKSDRRTIDETALLIDYHDYQLRSDQAIRKLLGRMSFETYEKLIDLKLADNLGKDPKYIVEDEYFISLLEKGRDLMNEPIHIRDLAVNGHDLLAEGLTGIAIGEMLNTLLDKVIDGELENSREALIGYVREVQHDQ